MRGFPLVQALLVALGMAVLWGPLSATMHTGLGRPGDSDRMDADSGRHGGAAATIEPGDGAPAAGGERLPVRLHVRWTRPPARLLVEVEGIERVVWDGGSGLTDEENLRGELEREWVADWGDRELDVWVEAEWHRSAGREALEVRLEPQALAARTLVIWGEDEAADGTTMSWREGRP